MSLQTAAVGRTAAIQESGLLDQIIAESRVAHSDHEKNRARDIISELVNQVLEGEVVVSENLAASLDARVAELDRLISEETGLHVQVADDPLTCVARGGGRALELVDMHGNEFSAPE